MMMKVWCQHSLVHTKEIRMAQLPPKVPNMTPNWPDVSLHQRMPSMDSRGLAASNGGPSWADEFLNFSSTKRGSHRRSVSSDYVAFLEHIPMVQMVQEESRRSSVPGSRSSGGSAAEFDGLDEDQFMAMFIDDSAGQTVSSSNPSSPSDHNSMDDDKHNNVVPLEHDQQIQKQHQQIPVEPEEMESASDGQQETIVLASTDNPNNRIFDPKRIKRILANRQSAQRSRVKKLHYISELELGVNSLQAEVSVLSPRVAFLDHQRLVLNVDNSALKQRLAALAQDKLFKDAHQDALKREIERLRQVYNYQQSLKKLENEDTRPATATSLLQSPENISNHAYGSVHKEHIMISYTIKG